jgi:hypothetical protein
VLRTSRGLRLCGTQYKEIFGYYSNIPREATEIECACTIFLGHRAFACLSWREQSSVYVGKISGVRRRGICRIAVPELSVVIAWNVKCTNGLI